MVVGNETMKQKTLFLGLLIFAAIVIYYIANHRRPIDFEVPQGYVGWIRIKYNIAGAAPLPIKSGYYVASIPDNGLLETSTIEDEGWGADRFYYVAQNKRTISLDDEKSNTGDLVWASAGRTNETWMFIGTKKQWADAQRLIGGSDPGPLKLPITSESDQSSSNRLNSNSVPNPLELPPAIQSKAKKP